MKNIVMRLALALTLLLTLGAVFGSVASGTAHAATATTSINVAQCDSSNVNIVSSSNNTVTCFANSGSTYATIVDIYQICPGSYSGYVVMWDGKEYVFNHNCFSVNHETLEYIHLD